MASVVACDLSEEMLEVVTRTAQARGLAHVSVRQGAAEQLPFASGAFDLVVSRFSAHHWADLDAGLSEARRVLRPGGLAVFIDAMAPAGRAADTHLQTIELLRDSSHVRDYSAAEWAAALGRAGFAVESVDVPALRLEFNSWVERMQTPAHYVQALLELQTAASAEVREALAIEPDGSFRLEVIMLEGSPVYSLQVAGSP